MDIVTHKEPSVPVKILPCDVRSVSCPHSSIKMFQKHNRRLSTLPTHILWRNQVMEIHVFLLALQYLETWNLRLEIKMVPILISVELQDL